MHLKQVHSNATSQARNHLLAAPRNSSSERGPNEEPKLQQEKYLGQLLTRMFGLPPIHLTWFGRFSDEYSKKYLNITHVSAVCLQDGIDKHCMSAERNDTMPHNETKAKHDSMAKHLSPDLTNGRVSESPKTKRYGLTVAKKNPLVLRNRKGRRRRLRQC